MTARILSDADVRAVAEEVVRLLRDQAPANDSGWLSAEDAAGIIGMHPKTVVRMARFKGLVGHQIGRAWRFRRADLDAWIEAHGRGRSR